MLPAPGVRLAAALAVSTATLLAQPPAPFRTGVDVVELYVSVTDADGLPVTSLGRDDFEVLEDGQRRPVSVFAAGRIPLSLAVALDRSFSVAGARLATMKTGVERLLEALLPDDRVLLLAVGSRVDVAAPLGTDRVGQIRALRTLDAFGSTSLYDSIVTAIDRIQEGAGRRALVLVSDGVDRYSQTSAEDLVAHARTRDVLVFPVVMGNVSPLLGEVAALTGGRASSVREPGRLSQTLQTLASELHAQYLIGFSPARQSSGARVWRRVQVSVGRPGLVARTRQGYWTN